MGLLGDIGGAIGGSIAGPVGYAFGSGDIGMDILTGGAFSNAKSVQETNEKQMELANQQMKFQERMSNSAYQRAVADMRKAGLNPALAYQNGGASAPTGAMASLTAPRKGDIGAGLLNTAKAVLSQGMDIKQLQSQTDLNRANANVADVSAAKITANAKESEANTAYTNELRRKAEADTRTARANATIRESEAPAAKARSKVDAKLAPFDAVLDRIYQGLGAVGSAFRSFGGGKSPPPSRGPTTIYNVERSNPTLR